MIRGFRPFSLDNPWAQTPVLNVSFPIKWPIRRGNAPFAALLRRRSLLRAPTAHNTPTTWRKKGVFEVAAIHSPGVLRKIGTNPGSTTDDGGFKTLDFDSLSSFPLFSREGEIHESSGRDSTGILKEKFIVFQQPTLASPQLTFTPQPEYSSFRTPTTLREFEWWEIEEILGPTSSYSQDQFNNHKALPAGFYSNAAQRSNTPRELLDSAHLPHLQREYCLQRGNDSEAESYLVNFELAVFENLNNEPLYEVYLYPHRLNSEESADPSTCSSSPIEGVGMIKYEPEKSNFTSNMKPTSPDVKEEEEWSLRDLLYPSAPPKFSPRNKSFLSKGSSALLRQLEVEVDVKDLKIRMKNMKCRRKKRDFINPSMKKRRKMITYNTIKRKELGLNRPEKFNIIESSKSGEVRNQARIFGGTCFEKLQSSKDKLKGRKEKVKKEKKSLFPRFDSNVRKLSEVEGTPMSWSGGWVLNRGTNSTFPTRVKTPAAPIESMSPLKLNRIGNRCGMWEGEIKMMGQNSHSHRFFTSPHFDPSVMKGATGE